MNFQWKQSVQLIAFLIKEHARAQEQRKIEQIFEISTGLEVGRVEAVRGKVGRCVGSVVCANGSCITGSLGSQRNETVQVNWPARIIPVEFAQFTFKDLMYIIESPLQGYWGSYGILRCVRAYLVSFNLIFWILLK